MIHGPTGKIVIKHIFSVCFYSFELNLSVQQSGFTVYRKYKPHNDDVNKVKVGNPLKYTFYTFMKVSMQKPGSGWHMTSFVFKKNPLILYHKGES